MSDDVLECGAEVVVRADRDGTAHGLHRAEQAGLEPTIFALSGLQRGRSRCCSSTPTSRR